MAEDSNVKVGGGYVEDPNFVPNPADMYGTFNTSGTGAHHDPATVSPIFEVDRNLTAQEIVNALDPEHPTDSSRVVFAEPKPVVSADNEAEKENLLALAKARLDKEVVVGGPSEAEQEAAEEGDKGVQAAGQQDAKNAGGTPVTGAATGNNGANAAGSDGDDKDGDTTLKGAALEDALKERNLPSTGTADEKRKAVAEYDAKKA